MARAVFLTSVTIAILGASLFAAAGSLRWPMAWLFLLTFLAFSAFALVVLDPALVRERGRLLADADRTDAALSSAFALLLYPGIMVVCGLDRRFGWSPSPPALLAPAALGVFVLGYSFSLRAMRANPFFATAVRIQKERGHVVVDRGPYRCVRHPGYAGVIAAHLALPFALGSLWGLVPAVAGSLLLAARAVHEERVLERDLAGYPKYMRDVPWRLVPGVW